MPAFSSPRLVRESIPDSGSLVLQLARLGDFLQTTPLLAALAQQGPVQALVAPAVLPHARRCPYVAQAHTLDLELIQAVGQGRGSGPVRIAVLESLLQPLRELSPARVINLNLSRLAACLPGLWPGSAHGGWRLDQAGNLQGEPFTGFVAGMAGFRRLTRLHLCDILASYADPPAPPLDRLSYHLSARDREEAETLLPGQGPLVVLQLGAKNSLRRWPLEFFSVAARALMKDGVRLALVGSADESRLAGKFLQHLGPAKLEVINLIGRTSLPQLAAVLAGSSLVLSADTGTLHLASAVGALILGLYMGPAQVFETGPYGVGHLVLQARDHCGPCREHQPSCGGEAPCRRLIGPEAVVAASRALLAGASAQQAAQGLNLPPGVKALFGVHDSFGQDYQYVIPQPLDTEQALALALALAGRVLLRSSYRPIPPGDFLQRWLPPRPDQAREIQQLAELGQSLAQAARQVRPEPAGRVKASCPPLGPLASQVKGNQPPRLARAAKTLADFLAAAASFK